MNNKIDKSIPNDSQRRRALWISENLPETSEGYKVEATQAINPITGKEYDYRKNMKSNLTMANIPLEVFVKTKKDSGLMDMIYGNDIEFLGSPKTNEFIEYQFALASMDVADGKMSKESYQVAREDCNKLVAKMNQGRVSLALINEPFSFDLALNEISRMAPIMNTGGGTKYCLEKKIFSSEKPYNEREKNLLSAVHKKYLI